MEQNDFKDLYYRTFDQLTEIVKQIQKIQLELGDMYRSMYEQPDRDGGDK